MCQCKSFHSKSADTCDVPFPTKRESRINDQRTQSKMMKTISKRTLLHVAMLMALLCDSTHALAASATRNDNLPMYSTQKDQKPPDAENFIEYYKDHEISEKQARESLRNMPESDLATPENYHTCTAAHLQYCKSDNLLKDHCCCNQSHNKEQLYFIPHTCFINEKRCYPSLGSCLTVFEIRNRCCDAQLKRHWKSMLVSNANTCATSKYLLAALLAALLVAADY